MKETRYIASWKTRLGGAEFKVMRLQEVATEEQMADTPDRVVQYLRERLPGSLRYSPDTESFIVVFLNTRRRAIGFEIISNGTLDTILVHPREVFRPAIIVNAAAIVLAHNHPLTGVWTGV